MGAKAESSGKPWITEHFVVAFAGNPPMRSGVGSDRDLGILQNQFPQIRQAVERR
jgi:hypothetical protein